MNNNIKVLILALIFPIISASNQFLGKKAVESKNNIYLIISLCGYAFYGFLNYILLHYKNIATSNIIQYGSHIIIGIGFMIMGKLYFKETYSTQEYIGILFGIISMILLIFSKNIEN